MFSRILYRAATLRWVRIAIVATLLIALLLGILFPAGNSSDTSDTTAGSAGEGVYGETEFLTSDIVGTTRIAGMMMGRPFSTEVTYSVVGQYAITEGDIILFDTSTQTAGMALSDKRYGLLWPNGLVPYEISASLPNQQRIADAIAHWEDVTDIRFVLRDASNAKNYPDYITFKPGFGCSSYVGMVGGSQPITLAAGCSTGNTIHEIGHALGLWHEQSRIDRDDYVTVMFENIRSGYAFNFNKQIENGQDVGEYDYISIMHYPRWAFSKNGEDTIVPLQDVEIGQRDTLSEGDIAAIEFLYR